MDYYNTSKRPKNVNWCEVILKATFIIAYFYFMTIHLKEFILYVSF